MRPRKRLEQSEIEEYVETDDDGFTSSMLEQVTNLCRVGLTNREIAEVLAVSHDTFDQWLKHHKNFRRAVMKGRAQSDAKVAGAMFKMAIGEYEHEIEEPRWNSQKGEWEIIRYTKKYAPNVQAQIKWMNARQSQRWSDKSQVQHSHTVSYKQLDEISAEELTDEDIKYLDRITDKQLESGNGSNGSNE